MKKIIVMILLILILTGCSAANTIYYDLYMASIGLEYSDDEYKGYFYLPSSMDIGNHKSDSSPTSEVAKSSGKSLLDLFNNVEQTSVLNLNFQHISSLVLHESILKSDKINEIIEYFIAYKEIDKNFFIFITSDKIEDVYKLKNMNQETLIITALTEPQINEYIFLSSKPMHFLNFCRDYYNEKTIAIPYIEVKSIFTEDFDSILCQGVCFINRNSYKLVSDNNPYKYFNENINLSLYDNVNVIIEKYNPKLDYKSDRIVMKVSIEYRVLSQEVDNKEDDIKEILKKEIEDTFYSTIDEIDFLNYQYYNSNKIIDIRIKAKAD